MGIKGQKFNQFIAKAALAVTKQNVNEACLFYIHQPELPKGAEQFKKK